MNTSVAILSAIALLMPGFIIAELSVARSARGSRSDLELALRSLSYTLLVHVAFGFWTVHLVATIGRPDERTDHWGALTVYGGVVLLAVPVLVGAGLNRYLARAEGADGPPNLFAAAFGAGEARDAFDFAYQRWRKDGGWVIVELIGYTDEKPRLVGGIYGKRSAVGQTPSPHDVYLESGLTCCPLIAELSSGHELLGQPTTSGRRSQRAEDADRAARPAEARAAHALGEGQGVRNRRPTKRREAWIVDARQDPVEAAGATGSGAASAGPTEDGS